MSDFSLCIDIVAQNLIMGINQVEILKVEQDSRPYTVQLQVLLVKSIGQRPVLCTADMAICQTRQVMYV